MVLSKIGREAAMSSSKNVNFLNGLQQASSKRVVALKDDSKSNGTITRADGQAANQPTKTIDTDRNSTTKSNVNASNEPQQSLSGAKAGPADKKMKAYHENEAKAAEGPSSLLNRF